MIKRFFVLFSVFALTGCQGGIGKPGSPAWFETASQESVISYYRSQCEAYGYQPGTEIMAQCIQSSVSQGRSLAQQQTNQSLAGLAAANQIYNKPQPTQVYVQSAPRNCTTQYRNGTAYTNCY